MGAQNFRSWVKAVDAQAWSRTSTVFTDGEKALQNAFALLMDGILLLRCVLHIEQNVRHAMHKQCKGLGEHVVEQMISTQWKFMVMAESSTQYAQRKQESLEQWKENTTLMQHLDAYISINENEFVPCLTERLTLRMYSTQRVKGWHKDMKTKLNRRKPLVNVIERVRQLGLDRESEAAQSELATSITRDQVEANERADALR